MGIVTESKIEKPIRIGIGRETPNNDPATASIIKSSVVIIRYGIPNGRSVPIGITEPIGIWVIAVIIVDDGSGIGIIRRLIVKIRANGTIVLGIGG
jgi:hypothetical protein